MTVDADPRRRAVAFLATWLHAPPGADVVFRQGTTEFGEPAVVIGIDGRLSGFTTAEARLVADIIERMMREFPRETASMADLLVALRMCADRVDHLLAVRQ